MLRGFILMFWYLEMIQGMHLAIQVVEKIDLFKDVFFNLHKCTNYEKIKSLNQSWRRIASTGKNGEY